MNILFVCTYNKLRSKAAEHIFNRHPFHNVRSAGVSEKANRRVSSKLILWADKIYTMEDEHTKYLQKYFRDFLENKEVICLHIPDIYPYMSKDLVGMLEGVIE